LIKNGIGGEPALKQNWAKDCWDSGHCITFMAVNQRGQRINY